MPAVKCLCPGCQRSLQITNALPARVKCPRCGARLAVAADGSAILRSADSASHYPVAKPACSPPAQDAPKPAASPVALWSVVGGGAAFVVLGIILLIVCLSGGDERPAGEQPDSVVDAGSFSPSAPALEVKLVPVGFSKQNPKDKETPALVKAEVGPSAAATAKPVSAAENSREAWNHQPLVNQAIDRGAEYLKKSLLGQAEVNPMRRDTHHQRVGAVALAGLTLLSCGVPADDPAVVHAVTVVRTKAPRLLATYELSICVWFLDRLNDPSDQELIRTLALRLVAGQKAAGGWDYNCFPLTPQQQSQLLALLRRPLLSEGITQSELPPQKVAPKPQLPRPKPTPTKGKKTKRPPTKPAVKARPAPSRRPGGIPKDLHELPVFKFRPGQKVVAVRGPHEDNSLTQFVILALWAAQKHGVPAGRSLAFAEARFRDNQGPGGTWGYTLASPTAHSDSMTCAGLLGIAVGHGIRTEALVGQRPDRKGQPSAAEAPNLGKDPQIEKALLYLSKRIGRPALHQQNRAEVQKHLAELTQLRQRLKKARTLAEKQKIGRQITQLLRSGKVRLAGRNKTIGSNALGDLYFLWSLERVAVVYDLKTIGGKDWYGWGAEVLIGSQASDGSWNDTYAGSVDTCFALLFLKRVNVVQDLTKRLQILGGAKDPGTPEQARPTQLATGLAGINKNVSGDRAGKIKTPSFMVVPPAPPGRPADRRQRG